MSVRPIRIQRKRTAGYDMQAVSRAANGLDCISVTRPSRWGNPSDLTTFSRDLSIALYENSARGVWNPTLLRGYADALCDSAYEAYLAFMKRFRGEHPLDAIRPALPGHNLACYYSIADACNGDVLLSLANGV